MNLKQLKVFYAAARHGNFTRAAEELGVTQPAVTAQVRALEQALGLSLFRRRGRRLALTEAGTLLEDHARRLFSLEAAMEKELGELRDLHRGRLRIGTTKTYGRHVMPGLVSRFRAEHPGVRVVMDEGSSREVCDGLLELRNELGVLAAAGPVEGLTLVPFRREPVCLFAAPGHPLVRSGGVSFEELREQPIVMREEGSTLHALVRRCFAERGLAPTVLLQTSNSEFIKEMVARGEGVAFLVRAAIEEELRAGRLAAVPVAEPPLSLEVHIGYVANEELSPAARAFLGILERERREQAPG